MATPAEKFEIIKEITSRDNNMLNIAMLCDIAGVSRSGYYNWINSEDKRREREEQDRKDFDQILEAYNYRGYAKGVRSIYMRLLHKGIVMNHKKITRLMRKYNLVCPIRKANPYRRMAKAMKTSNIADNLVNREFKQGPRMVILTDITYLFYGNKGIKVYLSVMKDAHTNEILSYVLSESFEVDFVLETVNQLIEKHGKSLKTNETIMHSDQGCQYTSYAFQSLLKDKEMRQSMSRRGNCWDNAPQESFFGHMKDEIGAKVKSCGAFENLQALIDDYMDYYNNDRYQWDLAKLSPSEYYEYCITGIHPLGLSEKDDDTTKE